MQTRWGLSYKDATHRLYLAEVEKLRVETKAESGFSGIRERIDKTIEQEIVDVLANMDSSETL